MSNSLENSTTTDNLELNIEELPDIITFNPPPTAAADLQEAAQIATAAAASKFGQKEEADGIQYHRPRSSSEEGDEDDEINLLKRPNNHSM